MHDDRHKAVGSITIRACVFTPLRQRKRQWGGNVAMDFLHRGHGLPVDNCQQHIAREIESSPEQKFIIENHPTTA